MLLGSTVLEISLLGSTVLLGWRCSVLLLGWRGVVLLRRRGVVLLRRGVAVMLLGRWRPAVVCWLGSSSVLLLAVLGLLAVLLLRRILLGVVTTSGLWLTWHHG